MPDFVVATTVDGDAGFAGQTAPNPPAAGVAAALTASRAYAARFTASRSRTITKMAFVLTTASGTNDAVDMGIFDSTGTVLLSSTGSTLGKMNGSSGTQQQAPLLASVPLRAGVSYYAALAVSATAGAQVWMTTLGAGSGAVLMGAVFPNILQTFQAAFPLAAPFSSAGGISSVPILGLLE